MGLLSRISAALNRLLAAMAGVTLLVIVFLTCANILFRHVWVPIDGTFELVGFFGALVAAFALGHTQAHKGHIAINILKMHYPGPVRKVVSGLNGLICGFFFALCGWRLFVWGATLAREGEVTETLRIVYHPFIYCVALGCFAVSIVLFIDLLQIFSRKKGA